MRVSDDGSSIHHFIPKYFIKNFSNGDGRLFVYDKTLDRFVGNRSPTQLFYERDGNTAYWGFQRNTIPEMSFQFVDSMQAPRIREFVETHQDDVTEDLHGYMSGHMILQYLRVPSNRAIYERVYQTMPSWSKVIPNRPAPTKIAPNDQTYRGFSRAFVPTMLLRALLEIDTGPWQSRILEHKEHDVLIITDNPVVYMSQPVSLADFLSPCMLAVSKRRLYIRGDFPIPLDGLQSLLVYNAMAIENAQRLICASSELALRTAVEVWKSGYVN